MHFLRNSSLIGAFVLLCEVILPTLADSYNGNPLWKDTWTDKLKRNLFNKYDKFSRPSQHYNKTVITFDVRTFHASIDEFKSTITLNAWVYHSWIDEKLKWNMSDYGDIEYIHVGSHEVWQPDILLYNSGTGNTIEHYGDTHCIIYHNGLVLWVPPALLIALCDLDLRHWPFDTQVCDLKMGSWTFSEKQIDMELSSDQEIETKMVIKNSEWNLLNVTRSRESVLYPCCKDPYVHVNFRMTLKRNSALYGMILTIPAIAVVFLTLITFWLSPWSEMRVTIAACTILIISIFLVFFSLKVPLTPKPPLIVYFYSGCLCQVTISLLISVLVINASRRLYYRPLPREFGMLLSSWFGKLLGLSDFIRVIESRKPVADQELREKLAEDFSINSTLNITEDCDRQSIINIKSRAQLEWIMASTALDRASFIVLSLVFGIMAITCTI